MMVGLKGDGFASMLASSKPTLTFGSNSPRSKVLKSWRPVEGIEVDPAIRSYIHLDCEDQQAGAIRLSERNETSFVSR